MTANLNWAEPHNEPTVASDLFEYGEALYQVGRAVERGDREFAERAQLVGLAALGRVLCRLDPDAPIPTSVPVDPLPVRLTAPATNSIP